MRKLTVLTLLIPFFFMACRKKEGCTDSRSINYDPEAEVNDGSCVFEGYITFFSSDSLDNGPILVQIAGSSYVDYGYVTSPANISECGQAGGVHITLQPGTYSYMLTDDSGIIENGNITIGYNTCVLYDIP